MNQALQSYQAQILQDQHVLSVLLLDKREENNLILENGDIIYLIVLNQAEEKWETSFLLCEDKTIIEHRIHQWYLEQLSQQGICQHLYWVLQQGEIIFDRYDYLKANRERLIRLSYQNRKKRICEEYSVFLQYYLEAKEFLQQHNILDAYQAVLRALNGWATLVVSEAGEQQEALLWNQVKRLEPTVYKLYEELIAGSEPLEKRMELLLLPIEFQIMSKMKESTLFVTDIMKGQSQPMTFEDLKRHPEIVNSQINLALLLDKLVKRSFIQLIPVQRSGKLLFEQGFLLQE